MTVVLNERIGRITADDLDVEGLTEREMARLLRLRDHYPYSEFADSSVEWNRLVFLNGYTSAAGCTRASCRAGKLRRPAYQFLRLGIV